MSIATTPVARVAEMVLPTEAHTVILVKWSDGSVVARVLRLTEWGLWISQMAEFEPEALLPLIDSYKPLAIPTGIKVAS